MAKVLVVGAGVVGQATGKGMASIGHDVVFKDANQEREKELCNNGLSVWSESLHEQPDFIFMSVGTPTREGSVDLSQLRSACHDVGPILREATNHPTVVLRCTVPPGTTEQMVIPWLESGSGRSSAADFGVCYNPEFLRAVSAYEDFVNPWLIVIGSRDRQAGIALRDALDPLASQKMVPVTLTDLRSAEVAKYASNLYNATKISFTNEMWSVCEELGIDGDNVMSIVSRSAEGMWNPKYGTRGGFAYGGVCLPKDTTGFLGFARSRGLEMPLLEAVIDVNKRFELPD